ncbi:filamentous hemagglutinin N-terminal domain-containing protein, partial [bacterium]|nr:filamentous hemagglutinin N-terminal domain-containing protein [bacterium]
NNLFHSFSTFNLIPGQTAGFTSTTLGLENIIARVTGGMSTINGTLAMNPAMLSGTNLFLINPAGFIFGSSAVLSVTGSVHITTADYLDIGTSGKFYADWETESSLNSEPPSAFGFLENSVPADISISRNPLGAFPLAPADGKDISFIGGDIDIQSTSSHGTVVSLGGRVNIVSVGTPVGQHGEVTLGANDVDVSSFSSLGEITIDNNAVIGTVEMGQIYIRGGKFTLDNGSKVGSETETVFGNGLIDIEVTNDITIKNTALIATTTSSTFSSGNGANINITCADLSMDMGGQIISTTTSSGDGGNININSTTTIIDHSAVIATSSAGAGYGGHLLVTGANLNLDHGGHILSNTEGNSSGGDININLTDLLNIDSYNNLLGAPQSELDFSGIISSTSSTGKSGNIDINVKNLEIWNGGSLYNLTTGNGNAGNINVTTTENLQIWNWYEDFHGSLPGSLFGLGYKSSSIMNSAIGNGDAGKINIDSNDIEVSLVGSIASYAIGSGRGADLDINCAGNFTIKDMGIIEIQLLGSNSDEHGPEVKINTIELKCLNGGGINNGSDGVSNGGKLNIIAEKILLQGVSPQHPFISAAPYLPSGLYSYALGAGNGGIINLNVRNLQILDGATITASTASSGQGGIVNIDASESLVLDGWKSIYPVDPPPGTASNYLEYSNINCATESTGDGGGLNINASLLQIKTGAFLAVTTGYVGHKFIYGGPVWTGNGGNMELNVDRLEILNGGRIGSSVGGYSDVGAHGGAININASEEVLISGELTDVFGGTSSLITGSVERAWGRINYLDPNAGFQWYYGEGDSSALDNDGNIIPTITIKTPVITLEDTGKISAVNYAYGDAGNLYLECDLLRMDTESGVESFTVNRGGGGSVEINSGDITITGGAVINSSSSVTGQLGILTINSENEIKITGKGSGIFSTANNVVIGNDDNTGELLISSSSFIMDDYAEINSSSSGDREAGNIKIDSNTFSMSGNSLIASDGKGRGDAGSIVIKATQNVDIDTSKITTLAEMEDVGGGNAGDIEIDAMEVLIQNNSSVASDSYGVGKAGNILIKASKRVDIDDSSVTTFAEKTEKGGGEITILTTYMLEMLNSTVSAEAKSGSGSGGNILIDPIYVVLHNSQIIANAYGGSGGNITIIAQFFLNSIESIISASSQLSTDGNVEISAPSIDISGSIDVLPSTMEDSTKMLPKRCSSRKKEENSSFLISTRTGVNPRPDGLLFSP